MVLPALSYSRYVHITINRLFCCSFVEEIFELLAELLSVALAVGFKGRFCVCLHILGRMSMRSIIKSVLGRTELYIVEFIGCRFTLQTFYRPKNNVMWCDVLCFSSRTMVTPSRRYTVMTWTNLTLFPRMQGWPATTWQWMTTYKWQICWHRSPSL